MYLHRYCLYSLLKKNFFNFFYESVPYQAFRLGPVYIQDWNQDLLKNFNVIAIIKIFICEAQLSLLDFLLTYVWDFSDSDFVINVISVFFSVLKFNFWYEFEETTALDLTVTIIDFLIKHFRITKLLIILVVGLWTRSERDWLKRWLLRPLLGLF